jgi:hypothetical protein
MLTALEIEVWARCAQSPQRFTYADFNDPSFCEAARTLLRAGFLTSFIGHDGIRWWDAVVPRFFPLRAASEATLDELDGVDIDAVHYKRGAVRTAAVA